MRPRGWLLDLDRVPGGDRVSCLFVPVAVVGFTLVTLLLGWCQDRYGGDSLLYVNLLLLLGWLVISPLVLLLRVLERERQRSQGDELPPLGATGVGGRAPRTRRPPTQTDAEMDMQVTDAGSPETQPTCPYCRFPITDPRTRLDCPSCDTPHHRECWQANGGCTTYGCRARA